jgi:hypothetical protein
MQKQRKLTDKTKGPYAGPRGSYGQTVEGRSSDTSGTTYGGQGLAYFWEQFPSVVAGRTEYDPRAIEPGNNLSSVQWNADTLASQAGVDGTPVGASVGGTDF